MPLQEQSHIVIGHLTSRTPAWGLTWWGEERRYQSTAFPVRRPEEGETIVELRCGTCDAELLLRMRSFALSRSIRRRFLVTAAIGLGIAVVDAGGAFLLESLGHTLPLATALGKAWLITFLASLAALAVGIYGWRNEEGLRLYSGTGQGDETHRVLSGATEHDASPS